MIKLIMIFLISLTGPLESKAMLRALNTAASGMAAQEAVVNTIANNIANLSTVGFKKSRAETDDLNYQTIIEQGARTNSDTFHNVGVQIGSGAKVSAIRKRFTQGEPNITNNPFDLMINGDGFFGIVLPNGNLKYTRDGAFNVNNQGRLVTKNGHSVFPNLTFPPETAQVNISDDGMVDAYLTGQQEPLAMGQIPVFTFINPVGLKSLGKNLYEATVASGAPTQLAPKTNNAGSLMQGALESSNVNIMTEMTELIRAQRAYEMNSKVMGIADKMLQTVNTIR